MLRLFLLFLFILISLYPLSEGKSQTGVIGGQVIDQVTREPLPGANVQLLTTGLGGSADTEGRFTIRDVPVGTYQLKVSLVGYQAALLADVVVSVGKPVEVVLKIDQNPIDLETVEVTASYFQRNPDTPVSIQRLTYEEIRRSAGGFEDVLRAVSVLPGVAQVQPGRNDLVVRGGAPSENLYVVDNVEIPNINHFGTQGAGGGPLSYINLDFVRETVFSTGGFGVRYGDRLSSVLTIDLQDGRTDRIGGKATISASQFGLNLEGPLSDHTSFLFSARRSYLDIIFRTAGFSFVPEYWDFLARVSHKIDNANTITFLGIGAIDDVSFFYRNADDLYNNSRILGTAQNQYASGVSWQRVFHDGFSVISLGRSFCSYNGLQRDSLLRPIFTNKSKEGETSLRGDLVLKIAGGKTEISVGTQIKRVRFSTNLALPDYTTSFGDTVNVVVSDYEATGYKGGLYSQVSQHLPFGFQLSVGGRLDYFSLLEEKFTVAPRMSLTYDVTPLTSFTASTGIYYQNPSYVWLVSNSENRNLRPARVHQYILGIEHLVRADLKIRLEGFIKRYSDYPASVDRQYLVLSNTGAGFGGTEDNFSSYGLGRLVSGGFGRSTGIEFLLQKKLSESPLYGLVSLTYCDTRFTPLDGVERSGSFDQRFIANLSAGYRFDDRWEANIRFRYGTGRPYTPFNPDGTQDVSAYNSLRLPVGHSLDVRIDRRWNFSCWNLITYLDIQNIYNFKYTGNVTWNAREQRVETNENSIGILPSIGVSAEF